jgi:hypothetical protein
VRNLLDLRLFGGTELSVLIQNKFGMEYPEAVAAARRVLLHWIPALVGLALGALILLVALLVVKRRKAAAKPKFGFAAHAWVILLLLAFLLSPTRILGTGYIFYDCPSDVIASYEAAGASLASSVDPGGLVYWSGGDSAAPLLYIPETEIFPAQLNDGYTFRIGGDAETLDRLSYWDETLRTRWLTEADYYLIEDRFYDDYWVNTGEWVHLAETAPVDACREGASIHILGRPSP